MLFKHIWKLFKINLIINEKEEFAICHFLFHSTVLYYSPESSHFKYIKFNLPAVSFLLVPGPEHIIPDPDSGKVPDLTGSGSSTLVFRAVGPVLCPASQP